MKKLAIMLFLIPAIASAEVLPTRFLNPALRVVDNTIYVSDKRGNDWAVNLSCQVEPHDIEQFTVNGTQVLKRGKKVKLNSETKCTITSIRAV
jgi:hypothetical protein